MSAGAQVYACVSVCACSRCEFHLTQGPLCLPCPDSLSIRRPCLIIFIGCLSLFFSSSLPTSDCSKPQLTSVCLDKKAAGDLKPGPDSWFLGTLCLVSPLGVSKKDGEGKSVSLGH